MTTNPAPLRDLLNQNKPLIAAHRGASGYAPENTMAAYNLAVEMSADAIELDVHLSKEGIPVIIHDHSLERTTSGKGLVQDHTVEKLKGLDIGSWFDPKFSSERILTLEEVLLWAKDRINILIEIKNNPSKYADIAKKVIDMIRKQDMTSQVEVFSFDHGVVKKVNAIRPDLLTGVCYAADPVSHSELALRANADIIHPNFNFCTTQAIQDAHSSGIFVITWTVNQIGDAKRLIDMGVDCIKTDFPDKLLSLVSVI